MINVDTDYMLARVGADLYASSLQMCWDVFVEYQRPLCFIAQAFLFTHHAFA